MDGAIQAEELTIISLFGFVMMIYVLISLKFFFSKVILIMSWVRGDIQQRIKEIEKSIDEKIKVKNEVEAQLLKIRAELKEIKNELDKQYEALENNPDTNDKPKSKKSKR